MNTLVTFALSCSSVIVSMQTCVVFVASSKLCRYVALCISREAGLMYMYIFITDVYIYKMEYGSSLAISIH